MKLTDYLMFMLALVAWREARGGGIEGMTGILCVVRNRVRANDVASFGVGYLGVICKKWQFTSMSKLGDSQTVRWPDETDAQFEDACALAKEMLTKPNSFLDITNGALWYWNPMTSDSDWFKREIAGKRKLVAKIGAHDFYSDELVSAVSIVPPGVAKA